MVEPSVRDDHTAARFVGQSVRRVEDSRLITGKGRYVDDVVIPGMLHAAFLRSELSRASITRLDVRAASTHPGVHLVVTASEINNRVDSLRASIRPSDGPQVPAHVLAPGDVRFVGDPLAMVVADDRYVAEDAIDLIDVEYEPLEPVVDFETALETEALVHPELGSNLGASTSHDDPSLESVLDSAPLVFTETFWQQRQCNMPMETRGLIVSWNPFEERLDLWASTQSPHELSVTAARILHLGINQVRVHSGDVGGAFGQKIMLSRDEMAVILVGRELGRPVKWIEDRRENLIASNSARVERVTVTMALDDEARILALDLDHLSDSGAYPIGGAPASSGNIVTMFPGPYRVPHMSWRSSTVYTNTVGWGAYRGPWQIETVGRELMMDAVAQQIGIDPLEFRQRNVISPADLPYTTATGRTYDRVSPAETLEQAADIVGYDAFRAEQSQARREGRYLGLGISSYVEPTSMGVGALGTEGAVVRVEVDGSVSVYMGTGSHGQSLETTIAQVVADELGVEMESVVFAQGHGTPYGFGTGGSRSAVIAGGAARVAAAGVKEKLIAVAAHLLEAAPNDLRVEAGVIAVAGTPSRSVRLAEVAVAAYQAPDALPEDVDTALEFTARYQAPPVTYANSAHMCTCEVEVATGLVTLLRYVVSEDCGVMINPMVVEGQIAGGVVQGIGGALYEWGAYDADGNPRAATLMDYLVPGASEVPIIEYGHVVTPSDTPGGHKGVGEGGAIGAPPCVVNAVNDALAPLGVRFTRQPLTPDAIVSAIAETAAPGT